MAESNINNMGFFSNIKRKIAESSMSSIVGTTNTIAQHYLKLKSASPALSDKEVYEQIIKFRYSIMPLKENWRYESMLKSAENTPHLKELIFEIITNESPDLLEVGLENMVMTLDIIQEQLEKYNLR